MNESSELEQLRELIELFPENFSTDKVKEASRLARTRFDALDNEIIPAIAETDEKNFDIFSIDSCFAYCFLFHDFIFKDIISISGEFRNRNHPEKGFVYFGGQKHQEVRSRFTGSPPDRITSDLSIAFNHLYGINSDSPVDDALRFYQKFVSTHPFYDGNGRIARLFVNLYLYQYRLFIDWKNLQSKGAFLKKLNTFHESGLENHFEWWAKVCYKFVHEISHEDEK